MIQDMAMKKTKQPDRHKTKPITLRLTPKLDDVIRGMAESARRPLTTEITIAIEAYAVAAGLWPAQKK